MADLLLFRSKPLKDGSQEEVWWNYDARATYKQTVTGGLPKYDYGRGNLVDAWCTGTTREEAVYMGAGFVEIRQTFNSGLCALPPCGIRIDGVSVSGASASGPNASATVHASGYTGMIEYSLNGFVDSQTSNIFTGLSIGSYTAYARPQGDPRCVASFPFEVKPDWQVRWVLEYKTTGNEQARFEIEDRSWTGVVEFLRGSANPVSLEYPPIGNKHDVLGGSGLTLEILVEREGLLQDLYTSDERKFRGSLYLDNALEWRGFLLPEWYEEPWVPVGSRPTARISFSDGIGSLPDVYYVVENGLRYYGRATQLQVLFNCLDKLDLDLPFYTAVNVWETRMDQALDPLSQAYVEQSGYYDDTVPLGCGEVLARILNPYLCFVRQYRGALHVIPHPARKDAYVRRKYDSRGTFLLEETFEETDTILRDGAVSYREGSQAVGIRPAITLGKVTLEYGELHNYVDNGSFEDWSGSQPNTWSGDAQTGRALTEDGDGFRLHLSNVFTGVSIASTRQTYRNLQAVRFSFDWEMVFNAAASNAFIKCMVEVGGQWVKDDGGQYVLVDTEETFLPVFLNQDTSGPYTETSQKGTFEGIIPYTALEGEIQIRFYQPGATTGMGERLDLYVDNVRLEPYTPLDFKRMVVEGTNPGYNTVKPFEHTLYHGSGIPQSEALITLVDFTPADLWGEGFLLQEHCLREILAQHARPTRILKATLTGVSPLGVVKDLHMAGARFAVDGYVLDHRTGMAQVEAQELFGGPEEEIPAGAIHTEDMKPMHTESYSSHIIKES
jgi:hypothetical protein